MRCVDPAAVAIAMAGFRSLLCLCEISENNSKTGPVCRRRISVVRGLRALGFVLTLEGSKKVQHAISVSYTGCQRGQFEAWTLQIISSDGGHSGVDSETINQRRRKKCWTHGS